MFYEALEQVRNSNKLVHCITNYVTVNDCANVILAVGASPIMADDINEVSEITSICNALVINIGTLNQRTIESMIAAGKKANELGHPVVLDPVGAGASRLRTDTVKALMEGVKFSVIRGNISEIKTVYAGTGNTRGVDADESEAVTEGNLEETIEFAKKLAKRTGAVIAITGATDVITDGERACIIKNGHPMMSRVTGTGCMLSAILGGFAAAGSDLYEAVVAAVSFMGFCGEKAYKTTAELARGTATFKTCLIDYLSITDAEEFRGGMKVEVR